MRLHPARAVGLLRAPWIPGWSKDPLWRRARAVPSLDLRFADNKSLVDATTGQNLVTFSRASSATFVDSQGVIRNAVTNLLLQSEDFSTTWAQTNIGITPSAGVSPSGALTASKLVSTSGNIGYLLQTPAVLSGACTYSVYAKAAEWSWFLLWVFDGVSASVYNFDLQNGTSPDGTITAVGGGWYRCSKTVNLLGGTNSGRVRLYPNNRQGPDVTTGDGTSGIYLWGAQLEQSSTVGEYVPTGATINSAPRFDHNPTTGESLGLLVEESRSNLLLNSGTLSTQNVTVTAVAHTLSFTGTGTITLSGTSTAGPLVGTGTGEANRVSLTFTPTAGTLTLTVGGTVTNAQLEVGSFRTSYIPTLGTTVTRAADTCSLGGSNFSSWYSQSEGSFFWEGNPFATTETGYFGVQDAGSTSFVRLTRAFNQARGVVSASSVGQADLFSGNNIALGTNNKIAIALRANDFALSLAGANSVTDASGTMPTVDRATIGTGSFVSQLNGTIRRLAYWGQRLPNNVLQTITQ